MTFPSTVTVDVMEVSFSRPYHLGLTQVHAEAYWFDGEVYVSEHDFQLLWRLGYHDYIIGKDQV